MPGSLGNLGIRTYLQKQLLIERLLFLWGVFVQVLNQFNGFLWGIPVLLMILVVGILLTIKSNFAQIRLFPDAISAFRKQLSIRKNTADGTSGFRALCTALAATVGTGNIAGVAGAIAIGGPGAVFWMWMSGILGMVTKFAEVTLALHYRRNDGKAQYRGGPMYMIADGLPKRMKFLSFVYCILGLMATFGVGNSTQMNAVVGGIKSIAENTGIVLKLQHLLALGGILSTLITFAFRNGTKGICSWTERLVPIAAVLYTTLSVLVLALRFQKIPEVICTIFVSAFNPDAVTGGAIGSVLLTLRVGVSRGVFTNEAGMGTASIAHASADVNNPVSQGYMGIIEVFLDTIVLCTLTALVILCSGVSLPYGSDPGIILTIDAFSVVLGEWVKIVLAFLVCIFAFATVLGWGFYGVSFCEYLFGIESKRYFITIEAIVCFLSVLGNTTIIWVLSEIFNGLMAIPNLIALIWLMPVFLKDIKKAYR